MTYIFVSSVIYILHNVVYILLMTQRQRRRSTARIAVCLGLMEVFQHGEDPQFT